MYGEETYLLQEALKKIIQSSVGKDDDMDTNTYDARKMDVYAVLEDAQTIPFFSQEKVILVQNATFLSTNDDTNWDVKVLEQYFEHPMDSTNLIFIGDFEKLDARKKIVKLMQKKCKVLQFHKIDELGKKQYVHEQITKRHLQMEPLVVEALTKRLPLDILSIRSEFDKLALYGDTIDLEVVERLITRPLEDDVFELVNAVVDKNLKKAFHLWEDLCVLNKDAIYLIATLASQFRFLFQVKELMLEGKTKADITSILNAHPYRVQLTMRSAQNLELSNVLSILSRLADLDQKIKAGNIDKVMGFEMFLLSIQGV